MARMDVNRNAYRIFIGKPGRKRPRGRPSTWMGVIILKSVLMNRSVCRIDVDQDWDRLRAVVKTAMNI